MSQPDPQGICSECGRLTWDGSDIGNPCKLTSPNDTDEATCPGTFRKLASDPAPAAEPAFYRGILIAVLVVFPSVLIFQAHQASRLEARTKNLGGLVRQGHSNTLELARFTLTNANNINIVAGHVVKMGDKADRILELLHARFPAPPTAKALPGETPARARETRALPETP